MNFPDEPEKRGVNVMLVAHIAYRHSFHNVFVQDVDFLFPGEVTTGSFHLGLHFEPTLYLFSAAFPFPSEAKQEYPASL